MTKALEDLIEAVRASVLPYRAFTDAQLRRASVSGGDLSFPITAEMARLVLRVRVALRDYDAEAG